MPVDHGTRAEVYEALKVAHGEKVANALMEMLPPVGVPELATRADLGLMKAEMGLMKADLDVMRSDLGPMKAEMGLMKADLDVIRSDLAVVRSDMAVMRSDVDALEARLGERLERALRQQANRFIGWMLGTAAVSLAAAGTLSRLG